MTKKDQLQNEVVESWFANNCRSLALIGTGVGKTKILIKSIKRRKPKKILILVNSEDLRDSELYKEFIKWRAKTWLKKCEFVCYQTAYKWRGKHFDLVVGDEIDFAINTKYWDFFVHNTYNDLLLLTATLPEEKEEFIKKIVPISFRYSTQDAQDDNILNKTKFWYVNYLLGEQKTIQKWVKDEEGKWQSVMLSENDMYIRYTERIAALLNGKEDPYPFDPSEEVELEELERMELINKLTLQRKMFLNTTETSVNITLRLKDELLANPVNRIIIFSEFTTQADKISSHSYHSNAPSDNLNRFNNGEIREIAVCGKVNRGINLVNCNIGIFEGFSRSKVAANQRVGRLTRLDVDDIAHVFILVPHYRRYKDKLDMLSGEVIGQESEVRRTVIFDYLQKAFKDYDLSKAEIFRFT